jgi:hypothetical protein
MRRIPSIAILITLISPLGWGAGAAASATRLEASLMRSEVPPGEPIVLRLRTRADSALSPDLAPLEADFEIVGLNQVLRTTIVNGRSERLQEWLVQLLPRHDGVSEIPPISLRGDPATASAVLSVAVRPGTRSPAALAADHDRAGSTSPATFVEVSVDETSPYVQGQVVLRVKIYSAEPILSGQLSAVRLESAAIERVGDDRRYETTRDGRDYRVIESTFAIFPQQSGELRIPPVVFEGRVRDAQGGARSRARGHSPSAFGGSLLDQLEAMMGGGFGPSRIDGLPGRGGRLVRIRSDELVLDVRPRPAEAGDHWWLPAKALKLSEEWDSEPDTLVVGEQVTRSLIIQALGVAWNQIPEIALPEVAGLKQYREPSVDQKVETEDGLAAVKIQSTVVIPTEPGDYVLPEIEFEWWDTTADRARTATLPERRIHAVAAPGASTDTFADLPGAGARTPPGNDSGSGGAKSGVSESRASEGLSSLGRGVLIASGMLLASALGFAVVRRRQSIAARAPADAGATAGATTAKKMRDVERSLKRACRDGDAAAALRALREIFAPRGSGERSSGPVTFAEHPQDTSLSGAVAELQRARFAREGANEWDGEALWQAYRRSQSSQAKPEGGAAQSALPSLYPQSEI